MIGFLANRATRFVLEEVFEVDHEAAKWTGRAVGLVTGLVVGDISGGFDLPDTDTDVPDTE
jgi:hypothetical protein